MSGMHECQYYRPTTDTPNAPRNCAKAKKGKHVFRFHFPGQIQLLPELIPFFYILQFAVSLFAKSLHLVFEIKGLLCEDKIFSVYCLFVFLYLYVCSIQDENIDLQQILSTRSYFHLYLCTACEMRRAWMAKAILEMWAAASFPSISPEGHATNTNTNANTNSNVNTNIKTKTNASTNINTNTNTSANTKTNTSCLLPLH